MKDEQSKTAFHEQRYLAPIEIREFEPIRKEPLNSDYMYIREPKAAVGSTRIEYPGEPKAAPSRELIEYPQ